MVIFDVIQDSYNQYCYRYDDLEFFVCTHKHHPFRKTRNG